ncbi:potassium:proton antiporter [Campylobacter blaseri]|uniref:Potassium transporter n=1 Tax=Campylobacter blaseri TaxID=2042961 RepID=A0A2P8QZL2_9BACT|nr:cation:proton antiporter [Campylobacter blaseri]PSM51687.1 potassium transporter [Campylobacter blaseri]PSM53477.1 potassium transporter [Campylobacter blaseri]QKF86282.1 potassium:proton antiporter [Campylobacter blaseri]
MELFLEIFLVITALAIVLNVIFKLFDIPTIIGYIVTGIAISHMYDMGNREEIAHVAEFGIVFLMFTIGLEFSFKHLMSMKKEVFINGGLQFLITSAFITLLVLRAFDTMSLEISIIIACSLALSSTAIVLKILNDTGKISQAYGKKTLGILLFQDLAVIPILLMVDFFASSGDVEIEILVLKTLVSVVIVVSLLFFIGKYVFNSFFHTILKTDSHEIFIASVLFIVIGSSFLSHSFGFSYSLGAFIAGMLIAETSHKHAIEADLIPFRDILLGLFFITIGMQIDFEIIANNWGLVLFLLIGVMTLKAVVVYVIIKFQVRRRIAIKTSLSLCQVGEFALAILALMGTKDLLDRETSGILIAVIVISMFLTPFILNNLNRIANKFENEMPTENEDVYIQPQTIKDHFIIAGYGRLGQMIVQELKQKNLKYVVLESDLSLVELGRSRGENVYLGNIIDKQTLKEAGIDNAYSIIVAIANEQKLEIVAELLKSMKLGIDIFIRYTGSEKKDLFKNFDNNFHFIKEERAIAQLMLSRALKEKDKIS